MRTWSFTDKSAWPERGPWDDEPDKAHWVDEETGLDCLIHRGPSGALCGYVGIPEAHPAFGKDYDAVVADVHGGLTFADRCLGERKDGSGICHPKDGAANDVVWWLGFDCAHSGDLCPEYQSRIHHAWYATYCTFEYVKREVQSLARQLVASGASHD